MSNSAEVLPLPFYLCTLPLPLDKNRKSIIIRVSDDQDVSLIKERESRKIIRNRIFSN